MRVLDEGQIQTNLLIEGGNVSLRINLSHLVQANFVHLAGLGIRRPRLVIEDNFVLIGVAARQILKCLNNSGYKELVPLSFHSGRRGGLWR